MLVSYLPVILLRRVELIMLRRKSIRRWIRRVLVPRTADQHEYIVPECTGTGESLYIKNLTRIGPFVVNSEGQSGGLMFLWNDDWQYLNSLPLCGGNFNEILCLSKKNGGNDRAAPAMNNFHNALLYYGLSDLGSSSSPFTWMNKRPNNGFIQERLDRYMCSNNWRKLYNASIVEHGDFISSVYYPLILWLNKGPDNQDDLSNWDFKFGPYWLKEDGCREV
ncbi:LOW QUALITY PROTEIN: Endonuclease/exonuclease/phosphatase [Trema orientale]|uniref:Endonuclease/exonuclease/phosphatase n=1 Tax=Trema orientale TaxID=63057 RepID=A0A2P5F1S1_TREOI|nr:LOW QUALITY PROTEIN: Endonuclease/exonuclease/phosphatase [Trema orientale]